MIIEAKQEHIPTIAIMLHEMYVELFPAHAISDMNVYISEVVKMFNDINTTLFIDDSFKGFIQVRDETELMTPTLIRIHGVRVYIRLEYRKTRLLAEFYAKLFKEFPDGDIIGVTEINSEHIAVLDKRHTRIANMYKLNRGKK